MNKSGANLLGWIADCLYLRRRSKRLFRQSAIQLNKTGIKSPPPIWRGAYLFGLVFGVFQTTETEDVALVVVCPFRPVVSVVHTFAESGVGFSAYLTFFVTALTSTVLVMLWVIGAHHHSCLHDEQIWKSLRSWCPWQPTQVIHSNPRSPHQWHWRFKSSLSSGISLNSGS